MTSRRDRRPGTQPAQNQGVGLVEVLVTMVVITIGLLGVAGLQMAALNNSTAAFQRNLAVMQAQDLFERLWTGICVIRNPVTPAATMTDELNAGTRAKVIADTVAEEWSAAQARSGSANVSMPDWAYILSVQNNVFQIRISWSNDRIKDSSNTQIVRQVIQMPSVTCV